MMLDRRHSLITFVVIVISLGCSSSPSPPPPLKTDATYPQHENVAKFIAAWNGRVKSGIGSQYAFVKMRDLVPKGLERSRFADALSLATEIQRSKGKTYYSFGAPRTENDASMSVVVDEKTDKIVDVFIVAVHH